MKKYFSPVNLLFYFLVIIITFIAGSAIASASGVAKNQGLAAAAIVFGYGILTSFFALLVSVILVGILPKKTIFNFNKVLGVLCGLAIGFLVIRGLILKKNNDEEQPKKTPTKTTSLLAQNSPPAESVLQQTNLPLGLGMVKPDFYNQKLIYFYGNLNFQKALIEHMPTDSLVFRQTERGVEITYAPPWFYPDIMKMDYDVLYLRAVTLHKEFIEVMANKATGQTAWMSRYDLTIYSWPDFLFMVNSVEPLDPENNLIRIKPLNHASPLQTEYTFLRPLKIKAQWIEVEMLDRDLKIINTGWLRWQEHGEMVIKYSLFS